MNETVILISTCAASLLAFFALVSLCVDLLYRDSARIHERLSHEFQLREKQIQHKSPLFRDLKMLQNATGQESRDWWFRFKLQVEQSGLSWSAEKIAGTAVVAGIASAAVTHFLVPGFIVPATVGVASSLIPFGIVESCRQRRRGLLCEQLAEAFDQMKRSVRAGQPLMIAMQQIANDYPAPLADEFAMCCQQQEFGLSQAIALQDLARRVNIMELRMFVVAVLVQRDVGGNSAEILANLANVVRQRFRLASRVKALTAEGRMQAVVLTALPLLAGLIMLILNAEYAQLLLNRPQLLAGMFVSEVVGALWIRRIVNFDF